MCTGLRVSLGDTDKSHLLFGRNMDIEAHFGEAVTVTPCNHPLPFHYLPPLGEHYAIIGMAAVANGYPLYADAMNEKGLCMAGLHFPGNAVYLPPCDSPKDTVRIAPFELIPYLLGICATAAEVKCVLQKVTIVDVSFSPALRNTPLHWYVAAADGGLVIEATAEGLTVYDDLAGVLTNNPPYPYHVAHLHRFDALTNRAPALTRNEETAGETYDLSLGLVGLPGDYTSPARFVRCATLRRLTDWEGISTAAAVARFFRVLGAVAVPHGCVKTADGENHATIYTACMDTAELCYHLLTEDNPTPTSVEMTEEIRRGNSLLHF